MILLEKVIFFFAFLILFLFVSTSLTFAATNLDIISILKNPNILYSQKLEAAKPLLDAQKIPASITLPNNGLTIYIDLDILMNYGGVLYVVKDPNTGEKYTPQEVGQLIQKYSDIYISAPQESKIDSDGVIQWRYLGFTIDKAPYTNMKFPNDAL
ncbi:hypothetical protein [Caldanaerobacter sp.]|uniref:hypothetical protein n=1 Tax=Caldanaerobacter sp. TaxID=2930036 RepID=UPI003C749D45